MSTHSSSSVARGGDGGGGSINRASRIRQFKLVLLGDQGVGKSSLALRFVRGEFHENHEATIGAAFLTQTINVGQIPVKFDIWDTAGQERYHSLAPMYYRGASAAIVVYDVNNVNTFTKAMNWVKELRQQASGAILIVLAGNKTDLAAEHRAVSTEDGRTFAEENGLIFAEVSAKTGLAVGEVFITIGHKLVKRSEDNLNAEGGSERVVLREQGDGTSGCRC